MYIYFQMPLQKVSKHYRGEKWCQTGYFLLRKNIELFLSEGQFSLWLWQGRSFPSSQLVLQSPLALILVWLQTLHVHPVPARTSSWTSNEISLTMSHFPLSCSFWNCLQNSSFLPPQDSVIKQCPRKLVFLNLVIKHCSWACFYSLNIPLPEFLRGYTPSKLPLLRSVWFSLLRHHYLTVFFFLLRKIILYKFWNPWR